MQLRQSLSSILAFPDSVELSDGAVGFEDEAFDVTPTPERAATQSDRLGKSPFVRPAPNGPGANTATE